MGCNCGKKSAPQTYTVTLPDGQKKAYPSEIEAKAAVRRAGGGTYRKGQGVIIMRGGNGKGDGDEFIG